MIIELGIIQQDVVGAGTGHHNDRRHILKEIGLKILEARRLLKMQTHRRRRCYNNGCDPGEEELIRPSAIREGVL